MQFDIYEVKNPWLTQGLKNKPYKMKKKTYDAFKF